MINEHTDEQGNKWYNSEGDPDMNIVSIFERIYGGGGGGASNVVHGEFTAQSERGMQTIEIPYSGNGYPVNVMIGVKGGIYNPDFLDVINTNKIGQFIACKNLYSETPDYADTSSSDTRILYVVKGSGTGVSGAVKTTHFYYADYAPEFAPTSTQDVAKMRSNKELTFYVSSTAAHQALLAGIEYTYTVIYSE